MAIEFNTNLATHVLEGATDPIELSNKLDTLIGDAPSLDRLTIIASALGQPQILVPILDTILNDPYALNLVDSKSYQNVGVDEEGERTESFHSVVLAAGENGETQLRLWMPNKRGKLLDGLHDHGSDFASNTLNGIIVDRTSVQSDHGRPMLVYENASIDPTREIRLHSLTEQILIPGDKRAMHHSDIHEVSVPSDVLTATLAVRGKRKKSIGNAYRDKATQNVGVQKEKIDTGESIRRFRRVFP